MERPAPSSWDSTAERQDGVVSRGQLLTAGLTVQQARRDVDNRRWQTIHPGVYVTHTDPILPAARTWAGILYAGPGAVASHRTALWLYGAVDEPPGVVHVSVPGSRRVRRQSGLRIHHSRPLVARGDALCLPDGAPPRSRIECAVLDQCDHEIADRAVDLVLRAVQRRLTTARRLRAALAARARHRHRRLIHDLLTDVEDGVASPLELRYRRDVELPHGLPRGRRNAAEHTPATGPTIYRDVRYRRWNVVIELDGLSAHPREAAFRDFRRDNAAALGGDLVLRFGWHDVVGRSCLIARDVGSALRLRGWMGEATPCGPACGVRRVA